MKPYQQSVEQVLNEFKTNPTEGLSQQEAAYRLKKYGYNALPEEGRETWFWVFLRQFQSPLIYILLVAATFILIFGQDPLDAFIISGVLFFNAIIGTIQEGRTKNILESLKRFIAADSIVLRDGKKQLIKDTDLVPGDIIILQEGERIPADARLIESNNLQIDEAVLTGESRPVRKLVDPRNEDSEITEQNNMVFRGTYVLSGSGKAVVVATGLATQVGQIHLAIEEIETDMPLKRELHRLSYWILIFILCICIFLFIVGFLMGKPLQELLVMLTALFICVVPEGLPVVLTLVLVSGVYRMAKQHVLVKKMQAVEGLGRTEVIVLDKTGTLTRNEMMVCRVCADGKEWAVTGQGYFSEGKVLFEGKPSETGENDFNLRRIGIASSLLNTAEINYVPEDNLFDIKGTPTEAALFVFSEKLGLSREKLEKEYHKLYEIPFNPKWRFHAGFYEKDGKGIAFITGSPEEIIKRSENISELDDLCFKNMLNDGLRVVAVCQKEFNVGTVPKNHELDPQGMLDFYTKLVNNNFQFLGFCGIQDAIRQEVPKLIKQARKSGIKVIMATGDHKATALYVAKRVGIFNTGDHVIDGKEFKTMSEQDRFLKLPATTVYSRVTPQDKLAIVELFKKDGAIVAMTGDGVNDAPSLIAADLGIAMGSIGTEVAKQASDMILLDDSFVNIIGAIQQGRHIFYTLRRVVLYFFSTNMAEILIILFALLLNLPLPITAGQILWLNFVTDGFLDIGLSMEPQEQELLSQKIWLKRKLRLVDKNLLYKMMFMAVPMAIGSLLVFLDYQSDIKLARTMTLVTLAIFQWFNAWNCRSLRKSIFELNFFANKWFLLAASFVMFLQFFLVYTPFMQHIFKTVPLTISQWVVIFTISCSIIIIEEIRKLVVRKLYPKI